MILEGLVTTLDANGAVHLSPLGPHVQENLRTFALLPFQTSTTFANLQRHPRGVLHFTDDVELFAQAAIGRLSGMPPVTSIASFSVPRLEDACTWHAFRVTLCDASQPRARLECETVASGQGRVWGGFHRAKHAVLEAAILATRIGILSPDEIEREMTRLAVLVEKTAGEAERRAWQLLRSYVDEQHLAISPHERDAAPG